MLSVVRVEFNPNEAHHSAVELHHRIFAAGEAARSIEEATRLVHEALLTLAPLPNAYLAIRDPDDALVRFPYWRDTRDAPEVIRMPSGGLTEYVLDTGQWFEADAQTLREGIAAGRFAVLGTFPQWWCGIPVVWRGHCYGVFAVQTYDDEPRPQPPALEQLRALSSAIGAALLPHIIYEERLRRDAILTAAVEGAAMFLREATWAGGIPTFLKLLGRAARASRAYLFHVHPAPDGRLLTSQLYEWTEAGIQPQIDNPELQNLDLAAAGYQRWIDKLHQGEPTGGAIRLFPDTERPLLEAQGIKSLLVVPVHVDGEWWGFIGFDDCVTERAWSRLERMALQLAADVLAEAIHRERIEQQSRLQLTALTSAANGVMITDAGGRILWVNHALCRTSGYSADELIGQTPAILRSDEHDDAFYERVLADILAGRAWQGEIRIRRRDGSICVNELTVTPVTDAQGRPTHFIAIQQDVTERHQLREQLLQAAKMESIGRLAGGIAHDFNNVLQVILSYSAAIREQLAESDPRRRDVIEIEASARRATELTRQLLTFSRRQQCEMTELDLNAVIRDAERLLRRLLPENIRFELRLEEGLPPIRGNAVQIEQILVNLVVNARDAMPTGGDLRIGTSPVTLDADRLPPVAGARPGRYVEFTVEDTGHGMPPSVLSRMFEPFFTTKGEGAGTGLGLSIVYSLVQQHDGFIHVDSRVGHGTCFYIRFPAIEARPCVDTTETRETPAAVQNAAHAPAHILLVENEEAVRQLVERVLAAEHYQVTAVASVAEARRRLAVRPSPFSIVFSDLALPDGSGLDLADEVRRHHPGMKIVLSSGHSYEDLNARTRSGQADAVLLKPYPIWLLRKTLKSLLRAEAASP